MLWAAILCAGLLGARHAGPDPGASVTITVDSSRHELTIVAGPYDLPDMGPMDEEAMASMADSGIAHDMPVQRFDWPVEGWLRGFRVALTDAQGRPVPRHVLHHLIMANYSRRQLVYPAVERLMGAGTETEDVSVPKTIGVPMTPGMSLGLFVAWHNDTGKKLEGVYLRLTLLWTPRNQNPRPVNSMPIYMDVNLTVGGSNTFNAPPGRSSKAFEFTLPVSGRLLAIGGHMHDFGVRVLLQDAESGKEVTEVVSTRTAEGKIVKMSRKLFGVTGDGLKLVANHRYRLVGEYDNPTQETEKRVMAHMVGLFVPDDMSKWPAIDPHDAAYQRDLASLEAEGHDMAGMDHGNASATTR